MLELLFASALVQDPLPPTPEAPALPAIERARVPADTWASAGVEYELWCAMDCNADGFDDLVIEKPGGGLLWAQSVRGWKSAAWAELANERSPGGLETFRARAKAAFAAAVIPDAPPYEPSLTSHALFGGDLNGDKAVDTLALYRCSRPHAFVEVRVAFGAGPDEQDRDGDGLPETQERALGTDPSDRDSDDDGLLDGWEVLGLPRGIALPGEIELDPQRPDVVVAISPYEGVDPIALRAELERAAQLYRGLSTHNRDGSSGVSVHFRIDASLPPDKQHGGSWADCGNAMFSTRERGFLHWMQVTPWGGGQAQQTGDMGGCGSGFAVFAHEFAHQLSLSHEGDSTPPWCPLYPSLMSYAFSYSFDGDGNRIHFSSGRFREIMLDERALNERLPFPHGELAYLANHPFRFALQDDGAGGTRIDWNHNGRFDEGPVSADVNYGGSTNCGVRRNLGLSAAAPALAYVGGVAELAQVDPSERWITLKSYRGNEQWSEPRSVPDSGTTEAPLLVGTPEKGFLFFRRPNGWFVSRFDATSVEPPLAVAGLPNVELGGGLVGGRVLLVARFDDDALKSYWFAHAGKLASATLAQELELRSKIAPGFAEEPGGARIALASAMTNSAGAPLCLRVTWYKPAGERLVELETKWVRGEASGTNCTTRPSVLFDAAGELDVFHTGMPAANGLMTGWKTRRLGNLAHDEGWLTSLLYDIWTSSLCAVSAAAGPQGALYAFRWDADGWTQNNTVLVGHNAFGIDPEPMRDFDDGEKIAKYGLVHSILWMQPEPPTE